MDKKDIYQQMILIEEQAGILHESLSAMKEQLVLLLEENKRLSIENQQLRKILKKSTPSNLRKRTRSVHPSKLRRMPKLLQHKWEKGMTI